jgi:hypothetical protein
MSGTACRPRLIGNANGGTACRPRLIGNANGGTACRPRLIGKANGGTACRPRLIGSQSRHASRPRQTAPCALRICSNTSLAEAGIGVPGP